MNLDNLDPAYIHDDDRDRLPGAGLFFAALAILLGGFGFLVLVIGGAAWLLLR